MKILVDIGHPAHVHYFRNVMEKMQGDGHVFLVVARDKEVSQQLLSAFGIPFISRGKGARSKIGKLLYMLKADVQLLFISLRFRPDAFLSVVSPYAAQVAWVLRKPHIALDDTEHAQLARKFYLPFSHKVITPYCFNLDLGPKQVRMRSFFELFALHPKYKTASSHIRQYLGLKSDEPFAVLRFVSWGASHDYGQAGIPSETKLELIKKLSKTHRVFVSAEGIVPDEIEPFRIAIAPHEIHGVLYEADLYVGEGATMASECAMLGTPAIYYNSLEVSTIIEQGKHLVIKDCKTEAEFHEVLDGYLQTPDLKALARKKLSVYIDNLEDPNEVLMRELRLCVR
jgi:predicted glycosyltransferase